MQDAVGEGEGEDTGGERRAEQHGARVTHERPSELRTEDKATLTVLLGALLKKRVPRSGNLSRPRMGVLDVAQGDWSGLGSGRRDGPTWTMSLPRATFMRQQRQSNK